MKTRATTRSLLALALVAAFLMVPGTAMAGCSLSLSPNPGYRGANITVSGSGFVPNANVFVNFGGNPIAPAGKMTNGSGNFSFSYHIPNNYPVGMTNLFAYTDPPGCETNPNYQVNSGPPATTTTTTTSTTTTSTTTTSTTTTTTTIAPTTTVAGDTTTTVAGDTTTTVVSDTTTTTVAAEDDGGGIPIYIWAVIAALLAIVLVLIGRMSSRRR